MIDALLYLTPLSARLYQEGTTVADVQAIRKEAEFLMQPEIASCKYEYNKHKQVAGDTSAG